MPFEFKEYEFKSNLEAIEITSEYRVIQTTHRMYYLLECKDGILSFTATPFESDVKQGDFIIKVHVAGVYVCYHIPREMFLGMSYD